jgi:nucleoside-diphosphate-sugar epimerase
VEGTLQVLAFARTCPRLRKLVHVSTACVCGKQSGFIPEARLPRPASFVNSYEESKWEAEEFIWDSDLPAEIVRLSIVAGSEADGSVRRAGALHHTLYWLWKGLIPMMPGSPDAWVDFISTEHAARTVVRRAAADLHPKQVTHGCAGEAAPRLGDLLDHLTSTFSARSPGWQRGSISPPMIVDAATFALFEKTVEQSGDLLFRRVCQDSRSFLPGLLHPRQYETTNAGIPRTDWRHLAELVTSHVIDSRS